MAGSHFTIEELKKNSTKWSFDQKKKKEKKKDGRKDRKKIKSSMMQFISLSLFKMNMYGYLIMKRRMILEVLVK